jgi:hypothetical protein
MASRSWSFRADAAIFPSHRPPLLKLPAYQSAVRRMYRRMASAIPLCGCAGRTRQSAMRCSTSAAVLAVSRMNDPLSGFGSSSECDPKRLQRPLRIAAAFVRSRPLQRVRSRARSPDAPVRRFHLRRFDALDVYHAHGLRPDFSRRPLLGFTLRSFSLSLQPWTAVALRARAVPRASLAACRLAHARLPSAAARPDE